MPHARVKFATEHCKELDAKINQVGVTISIVEKKTQETLGIAGRGCVKQTIYGFIQAYIKVFYIVDKYADFAELTQNENEGVDYAILYREADSKVALIAPHGGGIEPGTIDIADALAGSNHNFYAFKGLKKTGNKVLHITSNRYDEPIGLKTTKNAFIVISIHGCRGKEEIIFIGGKNQELKQKIMNALRLAEFRAMISTEPGLRGCSPDNICNRCKSGKGVQLEISRGLREIMFENISLRSLRKKTKVFYNFVNTINEVLLHI